MTRMRDSMPIILFGLLIAFLITIVFEWGMDYMGMSGTRSMAIGEVNGKKISYEEFSEILKNYTDNQRSQTGELDDNALQQSQDQVWNSIVQQHVLDAATKRLGITVSDQEIIDWVRGDSPPDDLKQNFVDSTGQFRKDLYDQFLANPNQFIRDPEGRDDNFGTKWLADYEKNLRQRRVQEKLQSLMLASVHVTPGEVMSRFVDQNQRLEAAYALFDPNILVKDTDVEVKDEDIRDYYNKNLEQYKVTASRGLKYVQFTESASSADSAARKNDIDDLIQKARSGSDFTELASTYSATPDSGAFYKHGELGGDYETAVFAATVGDVVGPILDAQGYRAAKILAEKKGSADYVRASHILFSDDGDTNQTKAMAQRVAREAKEGKDFAALATQYSKDPGSAAKGGDLGWFGKGRMVKPFEDASFSARPGQVVGPIRSSFGWHIIKVHARDNRELKVAGVVIPIEPSSQTRNDIIERARDFAYNARQSEFAKEAQSLGLDVKECEVQENNGFIPGLGMNERVPRWAFKQSVGDVSEPYTIQKNHAVFLLLQVKDEGAKPFDEVKESIKPLALREKKIDRVMAMAAEAKAKLTQGDSLTKIMSLVPSVAVQRTPSFTPNGSIPGIGRDLAFLGTVSGLNVKAISPPVRSQRGAYVIQLLSRSAIDSVAFASQKSALENQILQEKKNRFLGEWFEKLRADADITDNRDNFFR